MPRVAYPPPDVQKKKNRLRMKRHQPRDDDRKRRRATKKNHTTRHESTRLSDRAVAASSRVFEGVDSKIRPSLNLFESTRSMGNPSSSSSAPNHISENNSEGGRGPEDEVILDENNMNNDAIMTDKSEGSEINLFQTPEHIYASGHQRDSCLIFPWDEVTVGFGLGDPEYDNTLKPTFWCSSEGSSPERLLSDHGWNTYHSPLRDELSVVSDDCCALDHGDQKFMSPFQSDISDSRNNTELWSTVEYHNDSVVGEDCQSATNTHSVRNQVHQEKKWFACLWYQKDPWKYRDCAKYELRRIKDVKQHAGRKHMKPDIYCPVCFELFKKANERDEHIQKKSCDSKPDPEFDGITEQQRKELNQKANRGKNEAEQWYYMWDTIFPNAVRPPSPYLGNDRGQLLPVLRKFWTKRGAEIISGVQALLPPKFDPQITQQIVEVIFKGLEMELSNWTSALDEHLGDSSWPTLNLPNSSDWILDAFLGDLSQQQWNPILMPQGSSLEQQLDFGAGGNLDLIVSR
ncbi:hypothetical protein F4776DRAFT_677395 [Hypoxylon sp. NC0597]|nr:hypothetical protein F4776DRAFT_677395 [Hypoxylon sp. NC0597]